MKTNRNPLLRVRYKILREAGFSSYEANKMKYRNEVGLRDDLLFKSGKVKKSVFEKQVKVFSTENQIDKWGNKVRVVENNSLLTAWGYITKHKPYNDITARTAKILQKKHKFTNKQAYYFLYYMRENGMRYRDVMQDLAVDPLFESYRRCI